MDNFKLKVSIGNSSVELEGDGSLVHKIFTELRENGLGSLTSGKFEEEPEENNYENIEPNNNSTNNSNDELNELNEKDIILPELSDFVIKGNPSTEVEWLLIYALYQSNDGSKFFTKEDLRQKYHDTNRFTETRNKNFSKNLKGLIINNYISAVNNNDYKITTIGKKKAHDILLTQGEGEDKKKAKRQVKGFTSDTFKIVEVGLTEDERAKFRNYYSNFKTLSNMDKAVVISHWMKENKQIDEIDKDIMFTMLKVANANTTFDIKAALRNAKSINKFYVNGSEKSKYKLHHIGEDYVKELLVDKE